MVLVWYLELWFIPCEITVPIAFGWSKSICSKAHAIEQARMCHPHHHMRSGKFDEGFLCDLLVIANSWVITLHVFASPQCQNLFAKNPNTSEPQCVRDCRMLVLVFTYHPMGSGKFKGVLLCDLWVVAGGRVITLHVSTCLYCQNLSSNYPNTPEAQCVTCSHVVVHALLFTHHIVCQNNLNSVLTKSGILKSAIWHLWEPQLTSQQIPPNRHWQGLSNDTKIILIGQELTLISGMRFWIVLSKWVSFPISDLHDIIDSLACMTSRSTWHHIYLCMHDIITCLFVMFVIVYCVTHRSHMSQCDCNTQAELAYVWAQL